MTRQLDRAAGAFDPEAMERVTRHITTEPGEFARNTRRLLYGLLGLGQPSIPSQTAASTPPPPLCDR